MEKQYLAWAELILYNTLLQNKMKADIDASQYDDADIKHRISSADTAPWHGKASSPLHTHNSHG